LDYVRWTNPADKAIDQAWEKELRKKEGDHPVKGG
jgi:hypothetical protein